MRANTGESSDKDVKVLVKVSVKVLVKVLWKVLWKVLVKVNTGESSDKEVKLSRDVWSGLDNSTGIPGQGLRYKTNTMASKHTMTIIIFPPGLAKLDKMSWEVETLPSQITQWTTAQNAFTAMN